jgi:hypothetical protein
VRFYLDQAALLGGTVLASDAASQAADALEPLAEGTGGHEARVLLAQFRITRWGATGTAQDLDALVHSLDDGAVVAVLATTMLAGMLTAAARAATQAASAGLGRIESGATDVDPDAMIAHCRFAAAVIEHVDPASRAGALRNLGHAHRIAGKYRGSGKHTDCAIGLLLDALQAAPEGTPVSLLILTDLAGVLTEHRVLKALPQREAFKAHFAPRAERAAARGSHAPLLLNGMGVLHLALWNSEPDPVLLKRARAALQQALAAAEPGSEQAAMSAAHLSIVLELLARFGEDEEDLDRSLAMLEKAKAALPPNHRYLRRVELSRASAQNQRHWTHRLAADQARAAVSATEAYMAIFQDQVRGPADLIPFASHAFAYLEATADPGAVVAVLARIEQLWKEHEAALADTPVEAGVMADLRARAAFRSYVLGEADLELLHLAAELMELAVSAADIRSVYRSRLHQLALILDRLDATGTVPDARDRILAVALALAATSADDPEFERRIDVYNLAYAQVLVALRDVAAGADPAVLAPVVQAEADAVVAAMGTPVVAPLQQIQNLAGIALLAETHWPQCVLGLWQQAAALIPLAADVHLPPVERAELLDRFGAIPVWAAEHLLEHGGVDDVAKALRCLHLGGHVLIGRHRHARELAQAAQHLPHLAADAENFLDTFTASEVWSAETSTQDQARFVPYRMRNRLQREIHTATRAHTTAPTETVTVHVIAGRRRAFAVVDGTSPVAVALDSTPEELSHLARRITVLMAEDRSLAKSRLSEFEARDELLGDRCPHAGLAAALEMLGTEVAQPIIDALERAPLPNVPARLHWVLYGNLAMLPLHAAILTPGCGPTPPVFLHQRFVCTLGFASNATEAVDDGETPLTMTVAAYLGGGENWPALARVEISTVTDSGLPRNRLQVLEGDAATPAQVTAALRNCTAAHLACHGIADDVDPIRSRLKLFGGDLDVEALAQQQLGHLMFVNASACETAGTTAEAHQQENLSIGAGFAMAGAQTVIGTLWPILNGPATTFNRSFYRMWAGVKPDERWAVIPQIANQAVREMLQHPVARLHPSVWAPIVTVAHR